MFVHVNGLIENLGRKITFEGREHIAAPVVILVEGVHRGSDGPLYYPASVLEASAQFWNGMPVPVHHPENNGLPISCNSPNVIEGQTVGRLWNVRYETDPKPRLKGEVYIDVNKAKQISPAVIDALNNNSPLEVSTGLFSFDDHVRGNWNGEDYVAVVRDIRPDHLALLPGAVGACSWRDGCGVRANKENGGQDMEMKKSFLQKMLSTVNSAVQHMLGNEITLGDKLDGIRSAVYTMDGPTMDCLIEAVFDDEVVYTVRPGPQSPPGTPTKMCRRKYSVAEDGTVALSNEVENVRKEVNYVPVANESEAEKTTTTNAELKIVDSIKEDAPMVAAAKRAASIYKGCK